MIVHTSGNSPALGNIWRITAKKTDFYLDPLGAPGAIVHVSVHGPNDRFDGHRFHIRVDRGAVASARERGSSFVEHDVPRKGFGFDGQQVADRAFRVARIRWTWHLQRPRFRAAAISGPAPKLTDHQSGARLSEPLPPNDASDIDLIVSYGKPYWPNPSGSLRNNARLGPLPNGANLWLTATSYRRSQKKHPAPVQLSPRLPRFGEEPNRILCCGPGPDGAKDMCWLVETITSRQLLLAADSSGVGLIDRLAPDLWPPAAVADTATSQAI